MVKAKITEIFSSVQGEGLYVGEVHTFVRFYGCPLSCKFCDEIKKTGFSEFLPDEVIDMVIKEDTKTVSLTGGEPLLQTDFLKESLPVLREKGMRIYLETNGTLKDELLEILGFVDIISMDIKLPSSTGLRPYWQAHLDFLKEAVKKEVFVKAVVTNETLAYEVEKAVAIINLVDKNIPFIIQPVSYNGRVENVKLLSSFYDGAKKGLNSVRVIPQVHKVLGMR